MTDRELLVLAAKAAGIDWFDEPALQAGKGLHMKSGPFWNPLADDGDALRLAVKLHMSVSINSDATDVYDGERSHLRELHHANAGAATRRAIVRAAAAIGEKMP
jgi:hypothetical protein